jgi:hypothetical protein
VWGLYLKILGRFFVLHAWRLGGYWQFWEQVAYGRGHLSFYTLRFLGHFGGLRGILAFWHSYILTFLHSWTRCILGIGQGRAWQGITISCMIQDGPRINDRR